MKADDLLIDSHDVVRAVLQTLAYDQHRRLTALWQGQRALVEYFDAPLLVQSFAAPTCTAQYGYSFELTPETLTIDDDDRLHGFTREKIPFVFTRQAQAQLFDQLDEFDDESITLYGQKFATPAWPVDNHNAERDQWWSEFYRNHDTRWDLQRAAPALDAFVPKLKLHRARILILGAGAGHDAAWFAERGHLVTACDFSQEALASAKQRYGHLTNINFVYTDAFQLPTDWNQSFDIVFEHTFYCAVRPHRRDNLKKVWRRALVETGHLMGVFFACDRAGGPPFGCTEWELQKRLQGSFRTLYWQRTRVADEARLGQEFFVYAQKLPSI